MSAGWKGSHVPARVTQACPATLVVHMAARAGDIQEWLVDARRREPAQRAEGIMRATCHRCLAPGGHPAVLMGREAAAPHLGDRTIARAR